MSLRATSPPPRATTPEPTFQPLPSPRLRPSRSIRQLKPLSTSTATTATLSSQEEFHLTFDEFGTDNHSLKAQTTPHRAKKKSSPTSPPSPQNHIHHHKPPRRPGSPPPPAHHHPTPPPPLPPLPSFLISAAHKPPNGCGFNIPDVSIFPPTPSTSSDLVNSRCYLIHRSN